MKTVFFASWLKKTNEWVSRGGVGDLSGSFGGDSGMTLGGLREDLGWT